VHVTLLAPGVTLRMNADVFRNVAAGLAKAVDRLDPAEITATGSTSIN
jgi:hypothetical protein